MYNEDLLDDLGILRFLLECLLLQVLRTVVSNRLARVQGFLFRAAFLRRVPTFFRFIFENVLLCFTQSALHSTTKYITGTLSLRFRKILTKLIHDQYFQVVINTSLYYPSSVISLYIMFLFPLLQKIISNDSWDKSEKIEVFLITIPSEMVKQVFKV